MEMQYYDHYNLMNFKLVFKIQSIYKSNKKLHFSTGGLECTLPIVLLFYIAFI